MRHRPASWCALASLSLAAGTAGAQPVLGPGADASALPHGAVRFSVGNQWVQFDQRFATGRAGVAAGEVESLGAEFTLDALDADQLPRLRPLEADLRALTGRPSFTLSLGATTARIDASTTVTPFLLEVGLFDRLTFGVLVPYVRARREVVLDVRRDQNADVLGPNPALANAIAQSNNRMLVDQLLAAAQTLESRVTDCQANPASSPDCPDVLAGGPGLVAASREFASGVVQVYGTTTSEGAAFVPFAESAAQQDIVARVADFRMRFGTFGIGGVTVDGPVGAPAQLAAGDLQSLLTQPEHGILAAPFTSRVRSFIGDVELGGKVTIVDGFASATADRRPLVSGRLAIGALYRWGTGRPAPADDFVTPPTGDGQDDIELSAFGDLALGSRLWGSIVARYTWQLPDRRVVRITGRPGAVFPPAYTQQEVDRDLGDYLELELTPRLRLGDALGLQIHYLYRHDSADEYRGTFEIDSAVTGIGDITLDARTLGLDTERREHRIGAGISYSSVASFERGVAPFPLEVAFLHFQSLAGEGGQPKLSLDEIRFRIYWPVFGARSR